MIQRRSLLKSALATAAIAPLHKALANPATASPSAIGEPIIDSHMHIATADKQRFPPAPVDGIFHPHMLEDANTAEKFLALMAGNGVVKACAVQRAHLYGYDNSYILSAQAEHPDALKAVLVVDARNPATVPSLHQTFLTHRPGGIRLMGTGSQHSGDIAWMNAPETKATWQLAAEFGIPVDVEVLRPEMPRALTAIAKLARRYPKLPIVVDHAGLILPLPSGLTQEEEHAVFAAPGYGWDSSIRLLTELANVHVKFTHSNFANIGFSVPACAAFVNRLVAMFGTGRVMWGSDYPQTRGQYPDMVALARETVADLSPKVRHKLLHENARRMFFA